MKTPEQKGKGAFIRMCVSCGSKKHKSLMIRITQINNTLRAVETNAVCGRSVYICRNEECISAAKKTHRPEKLLKCSHNKDFYDYLLNYKHE